MLASFARRHGDKRWFSAVGRAYVPLDRLIGRLTKGRLVALGLKDLPALLITTTGHRSGQPRTTPLLYATDGDAFVVIGSNWGQRQHPAWSTNLLANPQATLTVGGRQVAVRSRLVSDAERDRLRSKLLAIWPGYAEYERRAANRNLRIFRLEPT